MKKSILSCIQPTGNMHIGRYFGAIENWVRLQEEYDCKYGVVNYHAMTMPYDPKKLIIQSWDVAFNLLACGIKVENVFIQSLVPEHVELGWIFNCMCSYGELSRMTQFKDKSTQVKETSKDAFINAGLFTYPILQAADILIYKAHFVPVGKDQEQHLELTRNIAQRFNTVVNKEYFHLPEPLFTDIPKVMSTADPTRKMSAGVANLFQLLKAAASEGIYQELFRDYQQGSRRYGQLKEKVADNLIAFTAPFREKRKEILADKRKYKDQIKQSSAAIRAEARKTIFEVKELTGLLNVKT